MLKTWYINGHLIEAAEINKLETLTIQEKAAKYPVYDSKNAKSAIRYRIEGTGNWKLLEWEGLIRN